MDKREKVEKGLKCHAQCPVFRWDCKKLDCPYVEAFGKPVNGKLCHEHLAADAVELMRKEGNGHDEGKNGTGEAQGESGQRGI